jgi:APA family basic amino acid/polyamine antiporter
MSTKSAQNNPVLATPKLKRVLSSGFALSACVGGIIGLGILRTPGEIAAVVPDPYMYVGLWLLAGLFALLSISVIAELVGITPRSGGTYVLVKRAFGPYPGFLMGWTDWLSFGATIALKATVLVEYLTLLIPAISGWQTSLSVLVVSAFAALQLFGVRLGATIHQIAAAGMAMTVIGFSIALLFAPTVAGSDVMQVTTPSGISQYGLVAASIIFTYDGWIGATYFGGEIKGGGGAVARACIKSVAIILVLYVCLNAALAFSIPLEQLAGQELALAAALDIAFWPGLGTVVIVIAILILLAHQNFNYLQGPRILFALSEDGFGANRATRVGSKGNPIFAVMLTWALSVGLILLGGFVFLLNFTTLLIVFIYVVLLLGVVRLRVREPDTVRPYRAWGHPYSTWLATICWTSVSIFMAVSAPESTLSAVAMIAISIPIYFALVRYKAKAA